VESTARQTLQLIVSLASSGRYDEAASHAGTLGDASVALEAWTFLCRANANSQRWNEAQFALDRALRIDPGLTVLGLERALLAEQQGRLDEALVRFENLAAGDPDSPVAVEHLARLLQSVGREEDAARRLEAALARWPIDARLHRQLAAVRWRLGAAGQTTVPLERAIEAHPDSVPLRLVAAESLRNAGEISRALAIVEAGLARDREAPGLLTSAGVLLDELGRDAEALARLRHALRLAPHSPAARRNLVPALLRAGEHGEALSLLDRMVRESPDDQMLIAWRTTALRLAGDPAYGLMVDYERLVQVCELAPPEGFTDIAAFNTQLARELVALHRSAVRPLTQSLRGGTQTERNLPDDSTRHPAIAAFFRALDTPIRRYLDNLDPARDHPTDRRRGNGYRIAGSWSVRLQSQGFHCSHVHPQGWISSAYYVQLPAWSGEAREGWLKFGEPGMSRPVCPPDLFIQPLPGRLVLFPSFLWHGTVPFAAHGERLTAAFDVVPG
jgi:tetratricopeptide (TPR) repeat protein